MPLPPAYFDDAIAVDDRPDWDRVFGARRPLELEVGSGYGHFTREYARRHPGVNLIALEWRRKFADRLAERARREAIANLAVFRADARVVLPRWLAPAQLRGVHVLFPDPWWKARHEKRRLVDDAFARLLGRLVEPGGFVELRTDVLAYAELALGSLERAGLESVAGPGRLADLDPGAVPSNRERVYARLGVPVFRVRALRPRR